MEARALECVGSSHYRRFVKQASRRTIGSCLGRTDSCVDVVMSADADCLLGAGVGTLGNAADRAGYRHEIIMEHGIDRRGDFSLCVIKKIRAWIGDGLPTLSVMMAIDERYLMNGVPERA